MRAGNSIARGGRLRTALLPSEQTSDEVDALAAAQRDRYRTQGARLVLAVMPARRRMHVSAGRTSSVSQIASCASAGIVSYGPVCRLAPADSRRSLCSPEMVEVGLRFATVAMAASAA